MPTKTFAASLVAAAIPLAVPAAAAPLSQSLALDNAGAASVEQVQYRRWDRHGGGYYAYGDYGNGYYAYGAAPGYRYGLRSGPRRWNYGNGSAATAPGSWRGCPGGDRTNSSGYPSWMCW